jgi:heme/copper-type cytochrome/quinol oxidase subunit 1
LSNTGTIKTWRTSVEEQNFGGQWQNAIVWIWNILQNLGLYSMALLGGSGNLRDGS